MPRSPRLEYPGAVYHVTARGARQESIFIDDRDRRVFLKILAEELRAHDAQAFAYCLMGNHYHVVMMTRLANLSKLMLVVNGKFGIAFNARHERHGHVFGGRFKALHVDRDAYLLQACRYVDLNPVRARLVDTPAQWAWSSYRAHVGIAPPPEWLATAELQGALTGRLPTNSPETENAQRRYADWVLSGLGDRLWETALRHRIYLGDAAFVERVRSLRK